MEAAVVEVCAQNAVRGQHPSPAPTPPIQLKPIPDSVYARSVELYLSSCWNRRRRGLRACGASLTPPTRPQTVPARMTFGEKDFIRALLDEHGAPRPCLPASSLPLPPCRSSLPLLPASTFPP
jgi:hypothetical protein